MGYHPEPFLINGHVMNYCGDDIWDSKKSKFTCDKRVDFLMKKFLIPRDDVILNLLRGSEGICSDTQHDSMALVMNFQEENGSIEHTAPLFSFISVAITLLVLSRSREFKGKVIWCFRCCMCALLLMQFVITQNVSQSIELPTPDIYMTLHQNISAFPTSRVYVSGENVQERQFHLAPWDASLAAGGHELISSACQVELKQSQCEGKMPLFHCIQQYDNSTSWLSDSCRMVMDKCNMEGGYAISGLKNCKEVTDAFQYPNFNQTDTMHLENIMQRICEAFAKSNVMYWMAAGSGIGSLFHHGRIPWDDDVDMYVAIEDIAKAVHQIAKIGLKVHSIKGCGRKCISVHKAFDPTLPDIPSKHKGKHSFPFIDIFPIKCNSTHCLEKNEWTSSGEITYGRKL